VGWQYFVVIVADLVATATMGSLAIFAWHRCDARGARPFAAMMGCGAWWMLTNALYLASPDVPMQLLWRRVMFIGVAAAPVAWLCLTLTYAGRIRSCQLTHIIALSLIPLATTLLHWLRDADPRYVEWLTGLNFRHVPPPLYMPYDVWFVVHVAYSYGLMVAGSVFLVRAVVVGRHRLHRAQAVALVVGAVIPLVTVLPMSLGWISLPGFETAPFALTISSLFWAYGLFRFRMFDIVPAAHAAVIANLPDGLIVLDGQGRIAEMNPPAVRLLGIQPSQAVGECLSHLLPEWPRLMADANATAEHEVTLTRGEGEARRHFGVRVSPVFSRDSQLSGHVMVLRDVTRRVQLEAGVRQRNAQLSALSRVVLELSGELEMDALLRFITQQSVQMVGGVGGGLALVRPELEALEWVVTVGLEGSAPPVGSLLRRGEGIVGRVWESGQPVVVDHYAGWPGRYDRLPGRPHPGAVGAVPVRWAGDIVGVLGVAADRGALSADDLDLLSLFAAHAGIAIHNTELVNSLRTSEQRYRELADALPDAVFEVDERGLLTFLNRQGRQMFGYTPEDLARGLHVLRLLVRADRRRVWSVVRTAAVDSLSAEYTGRHRDGHTFPVWVHCMLRITDSRTTGFLGIAVDVTQRKQLEEQLQASLKEKETLLREIHHRVKNNLQVISSLLYLQSDAVQDDQARLSLTESQQRVKSLALLHEQMYQSSHLATVDFGSYIEGLIYQLRDSYRILPGMISLVTQLNHISLDFDTATPCSLIINELVSNAFKHAFPAHRLTANAVYGQPEIRVAFCPLENGCYQLVVGDNGVGLPEDLVIERTQSLGLRVVQLLTRQLRGTLHVDRQNGTTFTITFPQRRREETA
jgi:PAS domain S-box-containing protein